MASTDLMTYLDYLIAWETESDNNIDKLITEQHMFANLGDFESDSIVDKEFKTLTDLAAEVRDLTIAADATQMAADAAAVASIWSFGMGMAAYIALEATEQIEKAVISKKSDKLNKKLKSADTDISSQISPKVDAYVRAYKENNNLIISKAAKGLNTITCRSFLMQFMGEIQRRTGKLDAVTFRQYAESARIVFNSDEIQKVYDALDELNFSGKSDADIKKFMNVLKGFTVPPNAQVGLALVTNMSIGIMLYKLKIAKNKIKAQAEAEGIAVEEVETSAFEAMDAVGKFSAGIVVVLSVVDVILNIIDIVDVVDQCKEMCHKLDGPIKSSYKSYFNGIKDASRAYKAAISAPNQNSGNATNNQNAA